MSLLGPHINSWTGDVGNWISQHKPAIVKFLEPNLDAVKRIKDDSPNTFTVWRHYSAGQPLDSPVANARQFAEEVKRAGTRIQQFVDCVEGYNEATIFTIEEANRYNEWQVEYSRIMRADGWKVAAYSFSTGHPEVIGDHGRGIWRTLAPGVAESDYLGLHEYDAPTMWRLHREGLAKGDGGRWLALRYRRVWDLLPSEARKPIIISECGIDGGTLDGRLRGWKEFAPAAEYLEQLKWYDGELQKDADKIVGATIYCFGVLDPQWFSFDVSGEMAQLLSGHLQQSPPRYWGVSAPPQKPPKPVEPIEISPPPQTAIPGALKDVYATIEVVPDAEFELVQTSVELDRAAICSVFVLDEKGQPLLDAKVTNLWPGGHETFAGHKVEFVYGAGGMFWPPQVGPYQVFVGTPDKPLSNKITGLGLLRGSHVWYHLTFRRKESAPQQPMPAPTPQPVPPQPAPEVPAAPVGLEIIRYTAVSGEKFYRCESARPIQGNYTLVRYLDESGEEIAWAKVLEGEGGTEAGDKVLLPGRGYEVVYRRTVGS